MVTFKVLPLGSYAPIPAPSPPFKVLPLGSYAPITAPSPPFKVLPLGSYAPMPAPSPPFKVLPLGSYAPMPAPSPPFKTILEMVLWNGLQTCCCITPDVINVTCLPFNISFIFGNIQRSMGARSGEQAGCSYTVVCLVAKSSLTDGACE
jgi:hypothetical protein